MDLGGALLEVGIALGGGLIGAAVAVFKIGREVEKLKQAAENATKEAEEAKASIKELEEKVEENAKAEEKSWRDLSYMLGQIDVALRSSVPEGPPTRPDLPPVRPRLPSRPR